MASPVDGASSFYGPCGMALSEMTKVTEMTQLLFPEKNEVDCSTTCAVLTRPGCHVEELGIVDQVDDVQKFGTKSDGA